MVDNWGWGCKEIHWVSSPWILTCQRYKNLHVGRGLQNPVTQALILRLNFSLGIVYKSTATQGGLRRENTLLFAYCLNTAAKTKLEQPSLLQCLFATLPSCLPIPHFLTPNFLSLLFSLTLIQNKMLEVSRILFSLELLNNVACRKVCSAVRGSAHAVRWKHLNVAAPVGTGLLPPRCSARTVLPWAD